MRKLGESLKGKAQKLVSECSDYSNVTIIDKGDREKIYSWISESVI